MTPLITRSQWHTGCKSFRQGYSPGEQFQWETLPHTDNGVSYFKEVDTMRQLVFCFVTGFALVVSGCNDMDNTTADKTEKIEPGDVEDGEVPVGKEVTMKGDVTKVYDAHTFALSDPGIDFEQDLIVVTKDPLPFTAEDDAEVQVTGTVNKFGIVEVENDWATRCPHATFEERGAGNEGGPMNEDRIVLAKSGQRDQPAE